MINVIEEPGEPCRPDSTFPLTNQPIAVRSQVPKLDEVLQRHLHVPVGDIILHSALPTAHSPQRPHPPPKNRRDMTRHEQQAQLTVLLVCLTRMSYRIIFRCRFLTKNLQLTEMNF